MNHTATADSLHIYVIFFVAKFLMQKHARN